MKLGTQGLVVSKIGFGCMGITAFYGEPMEDTAALELLKAVHAAGCTHFDTAEVYRSGDPTQAPTSETKYNETIVGRFAQSVPRDSLTVATKFHPRMWGKYDLATVEKALDASLARLGLSFVDLYYLHRMPKTVEELKEWMSSAATLVKAGKIRYVGLSEVSPNWLRAAHEVFPVSAVQQEWSLLTRTPIEDVLVPTCVELGIGVVAYSPLARNLLSEQKESPKDWRSSMPRYSPENFQKNQELTAKISALGQTKHATASELSLAWLYHRAAQLGVTVCAIPGTTKIANAMSNIRSLEISLSEDEAKALESLGALAAGPRGNAAYTSIAMEGQLTPATTGEYCGSLRCANYAPCAVHPTDLHAVLSTGAKMPLVGFGTYQCPKDKVEECLKQAFKTGYRHIDCAEIYGNQREIGEAFKKIFADPSSGVKRQDVFITSKLWITDFRPSNVRPALEKCLKDLQLDYLDLYLMHIPVPCDRLPTGEEKAVRRSGFALLDTWRVLEACHEEGLLKAIGVSNFPAVILNDFQNAAKIVPAVNQIERHPYLSQTALVDFHKEIGIGLTAYSPLGAPSEMASKFGQVVEPLKNPVIQAIAKKHNKTPAQVLIRWSVDAGIPVIPKSATPSRIVENFDIFDFALDEQDKTQIGGLDCGLRLFEQADEGVPCFK